MPQALDFRKHRIKYKLATGGCVLFRTAIVGIAASNFCVFLYEGRISLNLNRQQRRIGDRRPWAMRATTLLCVLLLALVTVVQVAHVHPASVDPDHCPLCVVMHSAAPVAAVAPAIVFTTGSAPVPVPVLPSVVRRWNYTLFNRPPPADV